MAVASLRWLGVGIPRTADAQEWGFQGGGAYGGGHELVLLGTLCASADGSTRLAAVLCSICGSRSRGRCLSRALSTMKGRTPSGFARSTCDSSRSNAVGDEGDVGTLRAAAARHHMSARATGDTLGRIGQRQQSASTCAATRCQVDAVAGYETAGVDTRVRGGRGRCGPQRISPGLSPRMSGRAALRTRKVLLTCKDVACLGPYPRRNQEHLSGEEA